MSLSEFNGLFIGTKVIKAKPMNRSHYNTYRGWLLPADEDGSDEGYLVEYLDGGEPNHPDHQGYISWSPKEQFENAYKNVNTGVSFGHAIEMMMQGFKVARLEWNLSDDHYVIYVPGTESVRPVAGTPYSRAGITSDININPHFDSKYGDTMVVGWTPTQADMMSQDWVAVGKLD